MTTFSTYADAQAFLDGFINYEKLLGGGTLTYDTKSFDLDNFRALLCALEDPHLRQPVIHVAGTKGKGSTCAFLASVFEAAGYRAGLYTSPHLSTYRERIAAGGKTIPEQEFCAILSGLAGMHGKRQAESDGNFRTVFELLTATAFLHFARQEVDIAIVETGLGGRLDSTNVFDRVPGGTDGSLTSMITAIGLDHTDILGDTIEGIAGEKAGILRTHSRVVLGSQSAEWGGSVRRVVENRAVALGAAPLIDAAKEIRCNLDHEDADRHGTFLGEAVGRFQLRAGGILAEAAGKSGIARALVDGMELTSHLLGRHQVDNLRGVLAALVALEEAGKFRIPVEAVRAGVAATRWPGRFEVVARSPLVIVDGAHCALSVGALADTYADIFGPKPAVLVAGFMRDKAVEAICKALAVPRMNIREVVCCTPPSPRALPADRAAEIVSATLGIAAVAVEEPRDAVARALASAGNDAAVVAFGSMYLVAPAKETVQALVPAK